MLFLNFAIEEYMIGADSNRFQENTYMQKRQLLTYRERLFIMFNL